MIGSLYIALAAILASTRARLTNWYHNLNCLDVLGPTHPNLFAIPHRKFSARQPLPRRLFRKRKRQILVLVERALGPTQEPLAERHVRLDFALLTRERIVLDAQQGVEQEQGERTRMHVRACTARARNGGTRRALDGDTLLAGPKSAGE